MRLSCTTLVSIHPPPPTRFYPLSLHDALPISHHARGDDHVVAFLDFFKKPRDVGRILIAVRAEKYQGLRRSRFGRSEEHTSNSSHRCISYAVFCLKKKKTRTADKPTHTTRKYS